MTVAPLRFAIAIVSPRWSPWPCDTRMKSAGTSAAFAAAWGFPVRNGSTSTCLPSLSKSRQAWPSQRTRVAMVSSSQLLPDRRFVGAVSERLHQVCHLADVVVDVRNANENEPESGLNRLLFLDRHLPAGLIERADRSDDHGDRLPKSLQRHF